MITDIQAMREKMCELGRLLYKRKSADAAYILLRSSNLFAFAPEATGLVVRSALLKEEISQYGKSNE
jgi:hypothetical protein